MIDAMKEVISCLEKEIRKRNSRGFCILITLDVRNAFNSAKWPMIIKAMEEMGISEDLIETSKSYLTDRTVMIDQSSTLTTPVGYNV